MSDSLTTRLEQIDNQIFDLRETQRQMILAEPPRFERIALPYYVMSYRYVIILGDGSLDPNWDNHFRQAPAAFARTKSGGRYVLDLRANEILDAERNVVARVVETIRPSSIDTCTLLRVELTEGT